MLSDDPNNMSSLRDIPEKFGRDPSRILAALAESHHASEEEVTLVITLVEAQNALFPPFEFSAKWRFAYARAKVSRMSARLMSRVYYSASRERFAEITTRGRILTLNSAALRDEFGPRFYDQLKPRLICLSGATKTMMAFRTFTERAFDSGDFSLRAPKDWVEFLLGCMLEFHPAVTAETRMERYPWEALPAQEGSFLALVRDKANKIRDPTAAIRDALAPL